MSFQLNQSQSKAVNAAFDSHNLVLAPPGSGKTAVIVQRAIRVLEHTQRVYLITFTRKAAAEIDERVQKLTSHPYKISYTFHSFFFSLLRVDSHRKGIDMAFSEENLDAIFDAAYFIVDDYKEYFDGVHFLIDEFQDTDSSQYRLMKKMKQLGAIFFCVADTNQSIYRFRGANVSNVISFEKEFNSSRYELDINYRSEPHIVRFSNEVLSNNSQNILDITPVSNPGRVSTIQDKVEHIRFDNDLSEVNHIMSDYKKHLSLGNSPDDFAVIARELVLLDEFRNRLLNEDLPPFAMLTAHSSKGLQFETVYVIGTEDGYFPSSRAQSNEALVEEHRLFYVAITRAKSRLFLTSCNSRLLIRSAKNHQRKSQFLKNISSENLLDEHNIGTDSDFKIGQKINSNTYGFGFVVIQINDKILINFVNFGKKVLKKNDVFL